MADFLSLFLVSSNALSLVFFAFRAEPVRATCSQGGTVLVVAFRLGCRGSVHRGAGARREVRISAFGRCTLRCRGLHAANLMLSSESIVR